MSGEERGLTALIERARLLGPIRVAVVDAAQGAVAETLREAESLGLAAPILIGDPVAIERAAQGAGWTPRAGRIVTANSDAAAAALAARLVRDGEADAVMKGNVHTDVLMRALLDAGAGLRLPGRRVSHVFVVETPGYAKLLGVTDAAINIAPDLTAKAEIARNAIELFRLIGVDRPKIAALSAIETVNPMIASSVDAACLTVMARRGQIDGGLIDGPLAFDNAISAEAAAEKEIVSEVAGDADIVLVPDLVSGNILAKNLEYLSGAVAAGVVVGLSAPVMLSSRSDPADSRLAGIAIASLMFHRAPPRSARPPAPREHGPLCAPQPEHACAPLPA